MIELSVLKPFKADREVPSPNHGSRNGKPISGIILHATAGSDAGAESWMASPASRVSAHLHIRRSGKVVRLVPDQKRAWHAGIGQWKGNTDLNTTTLGWEIGNKNDGKEPYTDAQYATVAALLRHYLPQGIPADMVLAHATVAPGRKTDPLAWDWSRMWREYRTEESTDDLELTLIPPLMKKHVYSAYLKDYLIPVVVESDAKWEYVKFSDVLALPRHRAGTALSNMPEKPEP